MAKIGSFCSMMAILLLSLTLIMTKAARPEPVFADMSTPVEFQYDDVEGESFRVEENCDELGEDECLMRRSLAAHTDYIYTQKNKP